MSDLLLAVLIVALLLAAALVAVLVLSAVDRYQARRALDKPAPKPDLMLPLRVAALENTQRAHDIQIAALQGRLDGVVERLNEYRREQAQCLDGLARRALHAEQAAIARQAERPASGEESPDKPSTADLRHVLVEHAEAIDENTHGLEDLRNRMGALAVSVDDRFRGLDGRMRLARAAAVERTDQVRREVATDLKYVHDAHYRIDALAKRVAELDGLAEQLPPVGRPTEPPTAASEVGES